MIFYTIRTNQVFNIGQIIQKNNDDTYSLNNNTGLVLGSIMNSNSIDDSSDNEYQVYGGGGGGVKMRLGSNWNGKITRFEFNNDSIVPVESGGSGWIIPNYPEESKLSGDLVDAVIYK